MATRVKTTTPTQFGIISQPISLPDTFINPSTVPKKGRKRKQQETTSAMPPSLSSLLDPPPPPPATLPLPPDYLSRKVFFRLDVMQPLKLLAQSMEKVLPAQWTMDFEVGNGLITRELFLGNIGYIQFRLFPE